MEQGIQGTNELSYLILGADGYIGSYLFERLKSDNYDVIGTSRKEHKNGQYIKFDILRDDIYRIAYEPRKRKIAVFCIAQSNIDNCHEDYTTAYKVNVIKTREVMKVLSECGYKIIFFSTDNVFDGFDGNYSEDSKTNPLNDYGRMKEEVEIFALKEISDLCIFRLPKVLDYRKTEKNLLFSLDCMGMEENYRCIRGNVMSFLSTEDLYKVILIAVKKNLTGIFHVCGDEQILRRKFVERFYDLLCRVNKEVIECDITDMPFTEKRPLKVGMSNKKICNVTHYEFQTLEGIIFNYLNQ